MANDDAWDGNQKRCEAERLFRERGDERMHRLEIEVRELRATVAARSDRDVTILKVEVRRLRAQVDYMENVVGALVAAASRSPAVRDELIEELVNRIPPG